jgi:hypothetical protein
MCFNGGYGRALFVAHVAFAAHVGIELLSYCHRHGRALDLARFAWTFLTATDQPLPMARTVAEA